MGRSRKERSVRCLAPSSSSHWHSRPRPSRLQWRRAYTDPSGNQAIDPLAVSYLQGQGFSPGEIKVLVGQGDPLAVSYLRSPASRRRKWRPGRLRSRSTRWPSAISRARASHPARSKCSSARATRWPSATCATVGSHRRRLRSSAHLPGFDWADASIGAGATHRHRAAAGRTRGRGFDHPSEPQAPRRQRLIQGRVGALPLVAGAGPTGPALFLRRYGLMFWFRRKRLSGSYFRLTSTSRS